MALEVKLGYNPYKMGAAGGADVHSGYAGNEEWGWEGAHGNLDDTPEKRLRPGMTPSGEPGYAVSSAASTAVWATEITRRGLFDGMASKETYGTSGTLIRLRFFGGWNMPDGITGQDNFVEAAYGAGVPMGQDLPADMGGAKAPSFAVWAMKDPEAGNLDRVQIIKVWPHPLTKYPMEAIYNVAWSEADKRKMDDMGNIPAVGNTVDVSNATWTNDIGDSQLVAEWTDPDFDPNNRAAYYVRVLEIPTPRWSTYDAVKLGIPPIEQVPASIQERAWSSPIWYTPASN